MDTFIRLLVFCAMGLGLLVLNVWFARLAWSTVRPPDFVLAPITVIDGEAKTSGTGLAQMLQARLTTLEHQLADTDSALQNVVEQAVSVAVRGDGRKDAAPSSSVYIFRTVRMPTSLLATPDIDVKVAGVELGGVLPFLERFLVRPRQLAFSISSGASGTLITTGDIRPMVSRGSTQIRAKIGEHSAASHAK